MSKMPETMTIRIDVAILDAIWFNGYAIMQYTYYISQSCARSNNVIASSAIIMSISCASICSLDPTGPQQPAQLDQSNLRIHICHCRHHQNYRTDSNDNSG